MQDKISKWQFKNKTIILKDTFPTALMTVQVVGRGAKAVHSKEVRYEIKRDGSSTFTSAESNWQILIAIRGIQAIILDIITKGRIAHPAWSVYEIMKAHYDNKQAKQYGK